MLIDWATGAPGILSSLDFTIHSSRSFVNSGGLPATHHVMNVNDRRLHGNMLIIDSQESSTSARN
jgi:hypothetical protein